MKTSEKEDIKIGDTIYVKKGNPSAMGKGWSGTVDKIENGQAIVDGVYFDIDVLTTNKDLSY